MTDVETSAPPDKAVRTRMGYHYFAVAKGDAPDASPPLVADGQKVLLERIIAAGHELTDYDFFRGLKVALRVEYRL